MKKFFLLCSFACLLTTARAQRMHSMEFGIDVRPNHWSVYQAISDTFNATHHIVTNYLDVPKQMKGISYYAETYLGNRVLVYGTIGYLASRFKTEVQDSTGVTTILWKCRARTVWLGGGFSFALINTQSFKVMPMLGLDATNYDHNFKSPDASRYQSVASSFHLQARATVGISIGKHGGLMIRPYYLLPFWKADFYGIDKFVNSETAGRHSKAAYKQDMSCFGIEIAACFWTDEE